LLAISTLHARATGFASDERGFYMRFFRNKGRKQFFFVVLISTLGLLATLSPNAFAQVPVKAATWLNGHKGALSISIDDGQSSCFDQLQRNGFNRFQERKPIFSRPLRR